MKNVCIKLLTQSICYSNNNGVLKNRRRIKERGMGLVYGSEKNGDRNRNRDDGDKYKLNGEIEFGGIMEGKISLGQQYEDDIENNNFRT